MDSFARSGLALAASAFCLAGVLLSASAGGASGRRAAQEHAPEGEALREKMGELTHGLRFLQGAADAGDPAGARDAARDLLPLARQLDASTPRGPRASSNRASFVAAAEGLARALEQLTAPELTALTARAGADAVRRSCVECHVRLRAENPARGMFPSTGGVVSGRVELRDVDGEPLQDRSSVLLFLESDAPLPVAEHQRPPREVSQRGRRFEPRILPVTIGTVVEFPNDDTIFHNVFSLSQTAPFDLGIYQPGEARSVTMERTGLVKVYCNIHPDMAASIVVLPNALFALTDEDGVFTISDVPEGEYTLRAWHDHGGEWNGRIAVEGQRWVQVQPSLQATRRTLEHKNKFGQPYARKY